MKIIYGAVRPMPARSSVERPARVDPQSPAQARRAGHRHGFPALLPVRHPLRSSENMPWSPGDRVAPRRAGRPHQRSVRALRPARSTRSGWCTLSVGERQRVEIVRALLRSRSCSSWTSPPRCSPRRRCRSSSRPCERWPPRAAASSTSATSSTKSGRSAHRAPSCAAAG